MYDSQVAIWEGGDEVHVRHIVSASKDDADKVLAKLQGGADFAVLASKESIDQATRLEGGDLGWISEDDASPELQKVIKSTPVGGISKPFQTSMGWHVAKIEERRKQPPPTLEELRDPILKHLTMVQIGEVLKELRTKAKIQKMNRPQNAPIDTDPFTLAPTVPDSKVALPPPLEATATRPGVPETRASEQAPAPAAAPAKPDAAPAKTPARTPAKVASSPPAKPTAAPTAAPPAAPTATPPAAPPAATPATPPSGPVGESRQASQP
jgi:hypothetical protein